MRVSVGESEQAECRGATDGVGVLRERLRHVYWIGGGSGGGKSTVARRIAAQHGLVVYATDEVMAEHASRALPEDTPLLSAFKAMSMDERWGGQDSGKDA